MRPFFLFNPHTETGDANLWVVKNERLVMSIVQNVQPQVPEVETHITGKHALLVWNRISAVLAEAGVKDAAKLSKIAAKRLVEDGLVEGELFVPGKMHTANIRVTRLNENAVIPHFAHATDAGADLISVEDVVIPAGERKMVGTGIAIEIPLGRVGLVHPRSGLAAKQGITVLNTPGTIDSGYRGEVKVILYNTTNEDYAVSVGDRIAQLVIQEHDYPLFVEVADLAESDRGVNGIGSTGRN